MIQEGVTYSKYVKASYMSSLSYIQADTPATNHAYTSCRDPIYPLVLGDGSDEVVATTMDTDTNENLYVGGYLTKGIYLYSELSTSIRKGMFAKLDQMGRFFYRWTISNSKSCKVTSISVVKDKDTEMFIALAATPGYPDYSAYPDHPKTVVCIVTTNTGEIEECITLTGLSDLTRDFDT